CRDCRRLHNNGRNWLALSGKCEDLRMQFLTVLLLFVIAIAVAPGIIFGLSTVAFGAFALFFWVVLLSLPIAGLLVLGIKLYHNSRRDPDVEKWQIMHRQYDAAVDAARIGNYAAALTAFRRLGENGYDRAQYQ